MLASARAAVGSGHPLHLEVDNEVPIGSGLGSSAAAFTSGAAVALRLAGRRVDRRWVFELVSRLEGHADNAAAAVYGGLVLVDAEGRALKLSMSEAYGLLVLVPSVRLWTKESRRVIPDRFDRATVIRSLARTSALVTGLGSGDSGLLRSALGDEIHESSRNRLRPQVGRLMAQAMEAGAVYACWSGSGPSVMVVTEAGETARVADTLEGSLGEGVEVVRPGIAEKGIV